MPIILTFAAILLSVILYGRYRNKIWAWQELALLISGVRGTSVIVEVDVQQRAITENHVSKQTYVMTVEYPVNDEMKQCRVIVTDSTYRQDRYAKGKTINIIHSKKNSALAILDYAKYTSR